MIKAMPNSAIFPSKRGQDRTKRTASKGSELLLKDEGHYDEVNVVVAEVNPAPILLAKNLDEICRKQANEQRGEQAREQLQQALKVTQKVVVQSQLAKGQQSEASRVQTRGINSINAERPKGQKKERKDNDDPSDILSNSKAAVGKEPESQSMSH